MKKSLGFFSVLGLGINTIVGSGIFRLPAEMAQALGPAAIVVFVLCAVGLSLVALAYAEAASLFDSDGGAYLYAREAYGEATGFLVGWTVWLATVLTWATVAMAIPGQLTLLFAADDKTVATAVIVVLGLVNLLGVRPATWVSSAFAAVKIVPLVLFVIAGVFFVRLEHFQPFAPRGFAELPTTVVIAFFALSGFETAAIPGSASKHVPLAIVSSLVGAAVLYALIQFVAFGVSPGIGGSLHPLADASSVFLGGASGTIIAVAGAISMLGLCAAMAVTAPMLLTALCRDRLLPNRLGTPTTAVLVSTGATVLAALAYDFRGLVGFTSVTLILQYLATCAAVPVLRKKYPDRPRMVRLATPLLAIAGAGLAYLLYLCQLSELVGAAIVLLAGMLIYGAHRLKPAT